MRIGFYAPMKPPGHSSPSGDRTMARSLIEAMAFAGHEVQVMSDFRSLDIHGDPATQQSLESTGKETAVGILKAVKSGAVPPVDLWFTYHLFHKAPDWLGPEVSMTLGIPYAVAEASYAPKQQKGPWHTGLAQVETALRAAAGIASLNPRDLECIQPFLSIDAKQTALLPFARDRTSLDQTGKVLKKTLSRKLGIDPGDPWLVTVAMMRKGDKERSYHMLASALAQITDLRWRLVVIGDGEVGDSVRDAFEPLGRERICFCGMLDSSETERYLEAGDVFVWPAIHEAFGMAILEAQRHGLPVVAGFTDGVATIVEDRSSGLLTASEETDAFAEAMRTLIEDHDLRKSMGNNARKKFLKNHTLEATSQTLDGFLRSLKTR